MSPDQQRVHQQRVLGTSHDAFATGPKWGFAVDTEDTQGVAYVEADLANSNAPPGEANISYASHPDHRGNGYVGRAGRLVLRFLADHTAARWAYIVIDAENAASLRVARAVGATELERRRNDDGRVMVRHRLDISGREEPPPMLVP